MSFHGQSSRITLVDLVDLIEGPVPSRERTPYAINAAPRLLRTLSLGIHGTGVGVRMVVCLPNR